MILMIMVMGLIPLVFNTCAVDLVSRIPYMQYSAVDRDHDNRIVSVDSHITSIIIPLSLGRILFFSVDIYFV